MSKKESPATKAAKALAAAKWQKATEADRERLRTLRAVETACKRCGVMCPTARLARVHCVKARTGQK